MKEFTSTSFGLLIAYLVPGVVGFHALASVFQGLDKLYLSFLTATSNVGMFFYVVLIALIIGLQLSVFRWAVYEWYVFEVVPRYQLPKELFKKLGEGDKLSAFRAAVDELYRYHQCWGGLSIAYLMFIWFAPVPAPVPSFVWYPASLAVELITIIGAFNSYGRFADKVNAILNEG